MSRRGLGRGTIATILLLAGLGFVIAIFLHSTDEVRDDPHVIQPNAIQANVVQENELQRGDKEISRAATAAIDAARRQLADLAVDYSSDSVPQPKDLSYLADYAYSEVPPDNNPAEIVLQSLVDIPVGTPVDEIKLASNAFGLDFTFMKAVARIESDFDPKQRTGSYIGLFQLSNYEFARFGFGDITSPRDNAIAAAYKFATAAVLFEIDTHIKPTLFDLYLIHQQGWQGAAEHVSHPERVAWQSMCATDEGHDKGEKWCKRAIWQNTLPDIKRIYKSVENLTSGAFTEMWRQRLALFYSRYSETAVSAK
jgi:hypothetical protein